uniref:Conserved hypothetical plastid protein n=1 Tax=Calliarthron tuberculosum TaxID=48942 RepID=M4ITW4_CALTB|nr:conserved hypothetical plastid protein [Calliarthron tuberculosum]AGA63896.1 conserved hypothetical plastid protein [Calliarthron tuberculosum]
MNLQNIKLLNYFNNRKLITLFSNTSDLNQDYLIQKHTTKIIIQGITNNCLKDKIFQSLQISHFFKFKNKLKSDKISIIIKKLKYSGFFKKINLFHVSGNQEKCLIIQVVTNPIIRMIKISNINKLKISEKDLVNILKIQIGYPRNLVLIDNIIKEIEFWYFIRGYRWSKINYYIHNNNKLILNIREGQIDEIQFKCINNNNKHYKQGLQKLLLNELQVFPGQILNYCHIETGIEKLKSQKILLNCNYIIQYNNNYNLKIILKYRIPDKQLFYFFYQSICLPYSLLHLIYLRWFSEVINYKNQFYPYISIHNDLNLKYFIKIFDTNNLIKYNILIYKFWNMTIVKNSSVHTFYKLKNNLRFKFYFNQLNNKLSHCLISLVKSKNKNQISIIYNHPYDEHHKYCLNKKSIFIRQQSCQINKNPSVLQSNKVNNTKAYLYPIFYKKIAFTLTKIFSRSLYTNQRIMLTNHIYQANLLHLNHNWQTSKYSINTDIIKKIQFLYSKLASHIITIQSNTCQNKYEIKPNVFWKLSIHKIGTILFDHQISTLKDKLKQYISFQYKQTITTLNKNKKDIAGNILLNIKIDTIRRGTQLQYFPYNTMKINNYFETIQNSKYTLKKITYFLIALDLEFYINKAHQIACFIFIDSNNYINHFTNYQNNIYNTKLGVGIMINPKIKLIPIIKLKYELQNNCNCKLYATFYFK